LLTDYQCLFHIIQEKVYDLLGCADSDGTVSTSDTPLRMSDHPHPTLGTVATIEGLSENRIYTAADVETLLAQGLKKRHMGATTVNKESSRSHAVFTLFLEITSMKDGKCLCAYL
jgi:Kinesin motor domain